MITIQQAKLTKTSKPIPALDTNIDIKTVNQKLLKIAKQNHQLFHQHPNRPKY